MKTNLKSGNAIVRLLLAHGEKLGILAILVCTGLVVWSALGRERLDKEPSQLNTVAKGAQDNMVSATWQQLAEEEQPTGDEESPIVVAKPLPPTAMVKISPEDFPIFRHNFNPPVSAPVTLRSDPVLLAVTDLEVNSDSGLWASADPETIKRKMLDAEKERLELEREREAQRERAEREGQNRRGGGPGGYGGEGYSGRGGATGRDGKVARDAPIVQRPRGGAQLQGFEDIREKSWVTILGRLPIKQQTEIYEEALAKSRGYNQQVDIPRYLGYQVERAEITSSGQGEWQMIKFVKKSSLQKEIATYPVNVPDVIDQKVNHPLLTHPLPPLILHEWGERVSHSSMPLAEEVAEQKMLEMQNPDEADEAEEPKEGAAGDDLFSDTMTARERARAGGRTARRGYGEEMGGGRGGYGRGEMGGYGGGEYGGGYGGEMGGGYGRGGEFGGEMGGYGGGEYGGEMGGGFGGMRGGSLGRGSAVEIAEFIWDQETSHVLFRYFDNTAKPGHSYRYRIRLAMVDVNHGVQAHHLDKPVTARRTESGNKKYRWTDWSEPSPVAGVPLPARIYLVGTEPAKEGAYTDEPEAEILIKAMNSRFAAEVARTEDFQRGSVINISDKARVIWTSQRQEEEFPSFDFVTGISVLDFEGGEKLSRDMTSISRVLLMDAAGHLYVQEELSDAETTTEYQEIIEAAKNDRTRGGGGRGRGGLGGEYGGGEYGGGEF